MLSESEIVIGCKKADKTAQRILHQQYAAKMYAVCCRYIQDREEAKDILQEGFIKVFKNFSDYTGNGPLGAWIRRIMVNTAISYLRKNKQQLFQSVNDPIKEEQCVDLDIEENDSDFFEKCPFSKEELLQMINDLPENLRLIFNLFALEKYTHKEIAESLHIQEGTSRVRLLRARKELQDKINRTLKLKQLEVIRIR